MSIQRTDRIYQAEDQQWYFSVRGNAARGPFESFSAAENALERHIRSCRRHTAGSVWPSQWPTLGLRRRAGGSAGEPTGEASHS